MTTTSKHDPALSKNIMKCIFSLSGLIILLSVLFFSGLALFHYIETNLDYFYETISPIIYVVMGINVFLFFTMLCCKDKTPTQYEGTHKLLASVIGILGVSLVLLTILVFAVHSSYRERNYYCKNPFSYSSIIPQSECTRIKK